MRLSFVNYDTGGLAHAYNKYCIPYHHKLSEAISEKFTIFGVSNCCCLSLFYCIGYKIGWLNRMEMCSKTTTMVSCENLLIGQFFFALNAITPMRNLVVLLTFLCVCFYDPFFVKIKKARPTLTMVNVHHSQFLNKTRTHTHAQTHNEALIKFLN